MPGERLGSMRGLLARHGWLHRLPMRRFRRRWVGWFAATTLGVLFITSYFVLLIVCREPDLEGRPATSWIRDLSQGNHAVAVGVFRRQGANAAPGLASAVDRRRTTFAAWLQSLPFHDSMPVQIKAWTHERTTMQELDRAHAIRMCVLLGADARAALGPLRRALADENPWVRGEAAVALAHVSSDIESDMGRIAALLSDPDQGVRAKAAMALGHCGQAARPMLEELRAMTNHSDARVVFGARLGLAMIEAPDKVEVTVHETGEISYSLSK
jgi:hypothetical protein